MWSIPSSTILWLEEWTKIWLSIVYRVEQKIYLSHSSNKCQILCSSGKKCEAVFKTSLKINWSLELESSCCWSIVRQVYVLWKYLNFTKRNNSFCWSTISHGPNLNSYGYFGILCFEVKFSTSNEDSIYTIFFRN